MALLEDIVSMIIVVFVLLIVGAVIAGTLFTESASNLEQEQTRYLEDYYATSVNNFVNFRESQTGLPVHVLLGNYISRGERIVLSSDRSEEVDIEVTLDNLLKEFYGEDNYYMTVRQDYVDTTFSFVIDGSDSVRIEREVIAAELEDILLSVTELFGDADASITANVYILARGSERDELCAPFDEDIVSCDTFAYDSLYQNEPALYFIPEFGSFDRHTDYLESDWIAGSVRSETLFRDELDGIDLAEEVHMIIPVFDQISGSSVPTECFEASGTFNYRACRLCVDGCPVDRVAANLDILSNYLDERSPNSVAIPVFSFDCNFRDLHGWKEFPAPDYSSYVAGRESLASDEGLCDLDNCEACRPPGPGDPSVDTPEGVNYNNVCFRSDCEADIIGQMDQLASSTGGQSVNIKRRDEIAEAILDTIEAVFDERRIEFGVQDPDRTRYVFERTIVLPNVGDTQVYLQVYEVPRAVGG